MTIKLNVDDVIASAICSRFGYDKKTADEKLALSTSDFVINVVAAYLKDQAADYLAAEASAIASRASYDSIKNKVVEKG